MPLYEYECANCGRRFEKIEKVTAPHRQKCPKCGGKAERLLSSPAIQFKGSGWYVTDYPSKGRSAATDSEAKESKEVKEVKEAKDGKESKKPKEKK